MPTNKSAIRVVLRDFVPVESESPSLRTQDQIFREYKQCPQDGFPWENVEWHLSHNVRTRRANYEALALHTIFDGYQTLEHIAPKMEAPNMFSGPSVTMRWSNAQSNYKRAQQRIFDESLKYARGFDEHTMILAFDNGRCVSPAKKPEQLERRRLRMLAAKRSGVRIQLPGDPTVIEPDINPSDQIPHDWRTRTVWRKYRQAVVDLLVSSVLVEEHGIEVYEFEGRNYAVWIDGELRARTPMQRRHRQASSSSASPEPPVVDTWEKNSEIQGNETASSSSSSESTQNGVETSVRPSSAYEMMGEFDHFALRYILNATSAEIASRKRTLGISSTQEPEGPSKYAYVYDMRSLVFRLYTTDTDLLLFSLWTLEHLQHRFGMDNDQLPQIYCVAPWKPYRVIDVSALYNVLKARLAPLINDPNFIVRSMCAQFMFWGGDLLPSPHFLTPKVFSQAYVKMNSAIGMPICTSERIDEDHPFATGVNGFALRILFSLAYGVKWVWTKQMKAAEEDDDDADLRRVIEDLSSMSAEKLEVAVRAACRGEKKSWRRQAIKNAANHPPAPELRVVETRLGLFSHAIYCIEHALECVPGASISLAEIGFVGGDAYGRYYIDVYEEMYNQMSARQRNLLEKLGLFSANSCYRWADTLLRKGDLRSAPPPPKAGETLAELAESVFIWPELDS